MKRILLTLLLTLVLISACAQQPVEQKKEEIIKLGFMGPLTATAAELGESAKYAVEMAAEEINEAGGINGNKLEIIYEDSKCDPKEATNAITKLATVDRVPAVVGGLCSAETFAASAIAEPNKVVMLSYCSSAPKITDAGDYIFRNYPSDSFQGKLGAEYAYNEIGARDVAMIYLNDDWGNGIKDTFTKRFKELGGNILLAEAYQKDAAEFKTQLTKIKAKNPDLIYALGFPAATIQILKEAKELGLDPKKMMGGDGSFDDSVAKDASEFGEGFRTSVPSVEFSSEKAKYYEERYGRTPTVCSVQAYDAVKIYADVISRVGTESEAIKNALYDIKFEGESGHTEFDQNGDVAGAEYKIMEIADGKWIKVK